jgi:hypothetical protein
VIFSIQNTQHNAAQHDYTQHNAALHNRIFHIFPHIFLVFKDFIKQKNKLQQMKLVQCEFGLVSGSSCQLSCHTVTINVLQYVLLNCLQYIYINVLQY